jgi:hypothetical protein
MPDSTTHWCSLCLAERGIRTPAQVDWPGIPICRECAAVTAANVSDEPALAITPTVASHSTLQ